MPAVEHSPDFEAHAAGFGEKVRSALDQRGMTQGQLIAATGLSRSYIKLLLNQRGGQPDPVTGETKPPNPTLDVIWRLADALDVDPGYLVTRRNAP